MGVENPSHRIKRETYMSDNSTIFLHIVFFLICNFYTPSYHRKSYGEIQLAHAALTLISFNIKKRKLSKKK